MKLGHQSGWPAALRASLLMVISERGRLPPNVLDAYPVDTVPRRPIANTTKQKPKCSWSKAMLPRARAAVVPLRGGRASTRRIIETISPTVSTPSTANPRKAFSEACRHDKRRWSGSVRPGREKGKASWVRRSVSRVRLCKDRPRPESQ